MMSIIVAPAKWQHVFVYIHNIIILSRSLEEHLRRVESFIHLIMYTGMILKLEKCFFLREAIDYLGHMIAPRRLHIAPKTINAVHALKYPTKTSELHSFLSLCNV